MYATSLPISSAVPLTPATWMPTILQLQAAVEFLVLSLLFLVPSSLSYEGSLHIHILLYLHGFGSPQALARFEQSRPLLEAALAAWVQSILQTSVEQVADTWCLNPDAALACLRPLPYNDWQRQAVGEDMDECVHLTSTGWRAAGSPDAFVPSPGPWYGPAAVTATADDCDSSFIPYPREYLAWGPEAPQTAFQESLLWDYRASLLACQMHSCRAKTCAKGWLGRHGFCRLGFWHWQDVSSPARPHHWMRRHGQELRCPALVRELPPGLGTFETERHHHWVALGVNLHFRIIYTQNGV